MVGRLVKKKNVGVRVRHEGERHAGLLAVGQSGHLLRLGATGDSEAAQPHPHGLLLLIRELRAHVLQGRGAHVQLVDEVLVEARDAELVVRADHSLGGLQLSQHQPQKRGLAHTVRAHDSHARIEVDSELEVLVERLAVGVAEGDVLEHHHGRGELLARLESEGNATVGLDHLREACALHSGHGLLPALCLPRQLGAAVTEAGDVVLHVVDLVLLELEVLHLVLLLLGTRDHVLVVVASVVVELLLVQVDNVRAHAVHEVLRVRDDKLDAPRVPRLQVLLQPDARLHVQVVRRLVQ
mmetsp:Transcript_10387/g.42235  ORF Transcript_10387/g.42235 Transcript_10387/m.42235 type:complete len:296 (-) Transcript_10387:760-1647(-)